MLNLYPRTYVKHNRQRWYATLKIMFYTGFDLIMRSDNGSINCVVDAYNEMWALLTLLLLHKYICIVVWRVTCAINFCRSSFSWTSSRYRSSSAGALPEPEPRPLSGRSVGCLITSITWPPSNISLWKSMTSNKSCTKIEHAAAVRHLLEIVESTFIK